MKISRLQYISQESPEKSHAMNIREACEAGVDWVQLRVKDKSEADVERIAIEVKQICDAFDVKLIINDFPSVAKNVNAAGLHVGKADMRIAEARKIVGEEMIIGATANTFEDILLIKNENLDYIGLGPLRFTETKKVLSPTLGFEGYKDILDNCKNAKIAIPIIAIGGICPEDCRLLMELGAHGVAVSGKITNERYKSELVKKFKSNLSN